MRYQEIENREQRIEHRGGSWQHLFLRTGVVPFLLSVVCCLLTLALGTSCSEWNTDTFGHTFTPANSQVRAFTHVVTVEYTAEGASVGGWAADMVKVDIEGLNVSINNNKSDSLAVLVYGYPASLDSMAVTDGSLTISSQFPYALYLNGLSLRSQSDVAVQSPVDVPVYLVVPNSSRNILYGGMKMAGDVILTGTGNLSVTSNGNCIEAASLVCQYSLNVTLNSQQGEGIHLSRGNMKDTKGTWRIDAEKDAISTPDSILLYEGTYQGSSREGAYLAAPTFFRRPLIIAASALNNQVLDSAFVAQRYDSLFAVWNQRVDTLSLQSDSVYEIYRSSAKNALLKFTARRNVQSPYMLISQSSILSNDTLLFVKKSANKK